MDFVNVIGVQFRTAGRIYSFNGGVLTLSSGDQVVVDTERGPSLGVVVKIQYMPSEDPQTRPLKPIIRRATHKDLQKSEKLTHEYVEEFTRDKIKKLNLNMKVLKGEIQFGGSKVLIYFTAPGRVDFRELVKELASGLRSRVELKQVGARDEAKLIGGTGVCGREFCCSTFLREFVPVSIRMAKNQNLALNPRKVSGGCGRLLCCLTYEDDFYLSVRHKLPPRGSRVRIKEDGTEGDVIKLDFLNQRVVIETNTGRQEVVACDGLEVIERAQDFDDDLDTWGDELDPTLFEEDTETSNLDEEGQEGARGGGPKRGGRDNRPGSDPRRRDRPNDRGGNRPKSDRGPRPGGGPSRGSAPERQSSDAGGGNPPASNQSSGGQGSPENGSSSDRRSRNRGGVKKGPKDSSHQGGDHQSNRNQGSRNQKPNSDSGDGGSGGEGNS